MYLTKPQVHLRAIYVLIPNRERGHGLMEMTKPSRVVFSLPNALINVPPSDPAFCVDVRSVDILMTGIKSNQSLIIIKSPLSF